MSGRYEEPKPPRFEVEQGLGGEVIRIRARRRIFPMLFLPVWLAIWSFGGVAAIGDFQRTHQPFLAFWLCGWAAGWLFAAVTLAWMFTGSERVRVVGGDLEIGHGMFGWTRSRLYRGRDILDLSESESANPFSRSGLQMPFVRARWGAAKFTYGGRTVYFAQGLDEAEGRMIVERLRRGLSGVDSRRSGPWG